MGSTTYIYIHRYLRYTYFFSKILFRDVPTQRQPQTNLLIFMFFTKLWQLSQISYTRV